MCVSSGILFAAVDPHGMAGVPAIPPGYAAKKKRYSPRMFPSLLSADSPLRNRSFAFYWLTRVFSMSAYQVQSVAVAWQVYELTGSALDLGLVGLMQFLPRVLL